MPAALQFEYDTVGVRVRKVTTGRPGKQTMGKWVDRGESKVTANALLVTLAPETRERKSDRVAFELIEMLKGGSLPVAEIRRLVEELEPTVSWRTVERVKQEMGIEEKGDPNDARKKWWNLPAGMLAVFDEVTGPEDKIVLTEVDVPDVPDTIPDDWTPEGDADGTSKGGAAGNEDG